MSCYTFQHSMQLQQLWKSKEVWSCWYGRFGDCVIIFEFFFLAKNPPKNGELVFWQLRKKKIRFFSLLHFIVFYVSNTTDCIVCFIYHTTLYLLNFVFHSSKFYFRLYWGVTKGNKCKAIKIYSVFLLHNSIFWWKFFHSLEQFLASPGMCLYNIHSKLYILFLSKTYYQYNIH